MIPPASGYATVVGPHHVTFGSLDLTDVTATDNLFATDPYVTCTQVDPQTFIYDVSGFSSGAVHGTLSAQYNTGAVIQDSTATPALYAAPATPSKVQIDTTPLTPTITLATGQFPTTNASPINFTVTFNKAPVLFNNNSVSATGSAFYNGNESQVAVTPAPLDPTKTFTVAVTGMDDDGSVALNLNTVYDKFGNPSGYAPSPTVTFVQPVLNAYVTQATTQDDPTDASTVHFTLKSTVSQLSDLTASDISFTTDAAARRASAVRQASLGRALGGSTYNSTTHTFDWDVDVSGMTGDGNVVASIASGVVLHDVNGLPLTATPPAGNDNSVTYHLAPTATVSLATGQLPLTSTSPIKFKVAFNKLATDMVFNAGSVDTNGSSAFYNGNESQISVNADPTDTKAYIVTVTGMNDDGSVTLNLHQVFDKFGNSTGAISGAATVTFFEPLNLYVVQSTPPNYNQLDPTDALTIHFTLKSTVSPGNLSDLTESDISFLSDATAAMGIGGTVAITRSRSAERLTMPSTRSMIRT